MHITLRKICIWVFFVYLFYLVKFSCQNTIFIYFFKKNCQWELWDKNGKKCRKVKKREKYRGPGRYMTIFSLFFPPYFSSSSSSSLLHCTAKARARLGVVSGWKIPEKGVGKENRAKTASFWPVFFFF